MIDNILSAPLSLALVALLLATLLAALLLHRQSRQHQQERLAAERQQGERDAEITMLHQRLEQSREQQQALQEHLQQQQQLQQQTAARLSEKEAELAVQSSKAAELEPLKQRLEQKEAELRRLGSELKAMEATSQAEKHSLEEKLALLKEAREQLNSEFTLLANRIFEDKQKRFTEHSQQTFQASVGPLREQIEAFRKKVEDVYDKESSQRNRLFGQIEELQKQTRQIGQDAINLTQALKGDNKAQGNWGEIILERLLEESGLHKGREYEVQVGLQDEHGKRRQPDVIIRLPEGKDIVIDSKVSLLHYEQYVSAADDTARQVALKQHVTSLRTHIQQLSGKSYDKLEGIRSLDFIFLFVPIESAFMAALQADPRLFQDAYDRHIVLVSPTTLLATLRTVENIWRYEKQNRNAEEIARQAGGLHDQFALLVDAFEEVGRRIDKAGEAYQLTHKRLVTGQGNLMRRVDSLRKLGAKTKKQLAVSDDDGDSESESDQRLLENEKSGD